MPMASITAYNERLPGLIAQWKLGMADAANIPHMKPRDRRSTLRSWQRAVEATGAPRVPTKGALKMLGIGVK